MLLFVLDTMTSCRTQTFVIAGKDLRDSHTDRLSVVSLESSVGMEALKLLVKLI
jgi:hypothetical protein